MTIIVSESQSQNVFILGRYLGSENARSCFLGLGFYPYRVISENSFICIHYWFASLVTQSRPMLVELRGLSSGSSLRYDGHKDIDRIRIFSSGSLRPSVTMSACNSVIILKSWPGFTIQ